MLSDASGHHRKLTIYRVQSMDTFGPDRELPNSDNYVPWVLTLAKEFSLRVVFLFLHA